MAKKQQSSYAAAGVDIDEMMSGLSAIKKMVKSTNTSGVLSSIGSFGGLFQSPGKGSTLVASADGVGTKLKVAAMANRHHTVGQDLINHCTNDILVQGATPLFFLDYLGTAKLAGNVFKEVVRGLCKACRENDCTLLGGETAEMPGLYPAGEYDLVGTIVGTVPTNKIITGESIRPGDVAIGLPSTGLHTNGYSLARKVIFEQAGLEINDTLPGTRRSVADVLLSVHRSYLKPVTALMDSVPVRGMAHITGGGLYDNIPRILPEGCEVVIDRSTWKVPTVFSFMEVTGEIDPLEMYRVFNMGIGYVIFVRQKDADKALTVLKGLRAGPRLIGQVEKGSKKVTLA
ncbi:MAG: phosphoribosylformylglycinamidine cyclo-ligase [Verrucomicrobia bacterium]|nr:phosphoribosylformylglycinamidine cyclo-ligase [Verrucomicrobiota bacterium]